MAAELKNPSTLPPPPFGTPLEGEDGKASPTWERWLQLLGAIVKDAVDLSTPENLAPNSQWQVASGISADSKMNPEGTGTMAAISVSSYTTGSNSVVCTTTDTGQLKVGDLVEFSAAAHADMRICLALVTAVVTNTSFTVVLPLGKLGASSAACTATPKAIGGEATNGTGDSFDGWGKTTTLRVWREDHSQNVMAGSKYSCGIKKGSASAESMYVSVPENRVYELQGRPFSFGMKSILKTGSGSRRLYITTNGTGGTTTYSAASSSSETTWQSVSLASIPPDATSVTYGVEVSGASGDVFYAACPMAATAPHLSANYYRQPKNEYLLPIVHIQFQTFLNASLQGGFRTPVDSAGQLSFAVRPYPETNGAIAPTVRSLTVKWEARCESINDGIGLSQQAAVPHVYGPLLHSQVGAMQNVAKAELVLASDGTASCFVNFDIPLTGTLTFTNGSAAVTGAGTLFLTELSNEPSAGNGMYIRSDAETSQIVAVASRASDTALTLAANYAGTTHTSAAKKSKANWYNSSMEVNGALLS